MRLTDLDPHWAGIQHWTGPDIFYIGLTLVCPHCRATRLYVPFKNPIDPAGWIGKGILWKEPVQAWTRTGDTFETITVVPSVDAGYHGHWHGFIQNGEVSP